MIKNIYIYIHCSSNKRRHDVRSDWYTTDDVPAIEYRIDQLCTIGETRCQMRHGFFLVALRHSPLPDQFRLVDPLGRGGEHFSRQKGGKLEIEFDYRPRMYRSIV